MIITSAYAQTAGASGGGSDFQAQLYQFAPLILIMVVFYFLLFRPQQQKAKELRQQQASLRRGDRVITGGGVIGTVARVINDDELEVQIAENVRIRVVRSTISTVLARTEPQNGKDPKPEEPAEAEAADAKKRRGATK
ncbi:MAG TPA: preprotein translocase subunit YajC [Stellaceae bacterium]|nr:preprotein translocase subunit YajC [Stellaceae bacterium]